jgi:Putative restriction endonuclease
MEAKTRATIRDPYRAEGKAELVHGEIVEMPPAGDDPGRASLRVATRLLNHRFPACKSRTGPRDGSKSWRKSHGPHNREAQGLGV